jgi:hypothetical protein
MLRFQLRSKKDLPQHSPKKSPARHHEPTLRGVSSLYRGGEQTLLELHPKSKTEEIPHFVRNAPQRHPEPVLRGVSSVNRGRESGDVSLRST